MTKLDGIKAILDGLKVDYFELNKSEYSGENVIGVSHESLEIFKFYTAFFPTIAFDHDDEAGEYEMTYYFYLQDMGFRELLHIANKLNISTPHSFKAMVMDLSSDIQLFVVFRFRDTGSYTGDFKFAGEMAKLLAESIEELI